MTMKMTLIKPVDSEEGVTREECEAICRSLGVKPKPPKDDSKDEKESHLPKDLTE
jgi:hypothetical protein